MPNTFNRQLAARQIKKSLLPPGEEQEALDELIATGEAVFHLINLSDLDEPTKNALYRLEKHFNLYAGLLTGEDDS